MRDPASHGHAPRVSSAGGGARKTAAADDERSTAETQSTRRSRGGPPALRPAPRFICAGPVFAEDELDESLCPWCIADGSAHEELGAAFVDLAGVGGYGDWDDVPAEVAEEVAHRTPGFAAWQEARWFTCCGDACAFLGPAGRAQLERAWAAAVPSIEEESALEGAEWDEHFRALDREHGPTAHVFRCLHCGGCRGYSGFA